MKTGGQTSRQRLGGGWRRINLGTRFAALWCPTSILQRMFTTSLAFLFSVSAWANPHGMTVTRGSATLTQNGSQLNVQVSRGAVLDWRSFNIQRGETTTFIQPSSTSVVWNRILDPNLSQVWGTMNANGWVVLMNQNGFYFGPNSVINVRGLMVTTVPVASDASAGGGMWQFNGTPPLASIINYGEIKAHSGGSVFLVSERVENHGSISAPGGTIGLYAGKEVLVSERPDGRGLSATVKLPAGSVDNHGQLIADAGTIALHAQVVNQNGVIQANSVREHHGVIELVAAESLQLGSESVVQAKGDAAGVSAGGNISLKSAQTFADAAGSQIDVSGGAEGGQGGNVEISAARMSSIHSRIDGSAKPGWKGGKLVLDPTDIVLANDGTDSAGSGTVHAGDSPDTLRLNVNSAFVGFSQIQLEATRDISVDTLTVWNLNESTGISSPGSMLTLEAGRNILFGENSGIVGGPGWSMKLSAGVDFSSAAHAVLKGIGGMYFGSGSLQTADGSISLEAGHEILLGSGHIRTVGVLQDDGFTTAHGGSISIKTGDGDVNAGTDRDNPADSAGYLQFTRRGYAIRGEGIGGIGTEYGGDLTIESGRDIVSELPTVGAYGPGNVTLRAGNTVFGKYIVANGVGTIVADGDLGSATSPVSLSLISGGWNVRAGNIYLNEVLNPNGVYNPNPVGPTGDKIMHRFDYASDSYLTLRGDNSVQLLGSNPAHDNSFGDHPPIIYPPSLDIQAGAGGVVLGNDIILAPSPVGHLRIETTDGGSVRSSGYSQLVMSDSGSGDYKTWVAGHSATLLHSGDADPVSLIVAGNLENIFLRSAKRTDITVGGDAVNFTFEGQNLNPNDVSHITIAGNYTVGSDRASIALNDQPTLTTFQHIFVDPLYVGNQELAGRLTYNPNTHTITLKNKMTETDLEFLLHPWVKTLDAAGNPITDAEGNFIKTFVTLTGDSQSLMTLFDKSQTDIPSPAALGGLQIGGPGSLALAARNMELGASRGIRSVGAFNNLFLPLDGASLTLDLQGDLKMTSSQIASFNGGNIKIDSQGKMNIGSQEQFSSDDTPKGIYTAHGGNVDVTSVGSIDLNGSRIATYDGGDIHIKTTGDNSDVNAGGGARGRFTVATLQRNPVNGKLETRNDQFFGSGIVALTRRDSGAQIGNITVSAKRDILASSGGVLQLAFNNSDLTRAHLDLNAGRDIIANRSGVLGANISLKAGRDIVGLIVGSENVNLDAVHNVAANVLGGGNVDVHGQSVSGSIVGGGAVGVSGSEISATVVSTSGNATTQGNLTGSVGGFANAAAPVAQQTTTETEKKNVAKTDDEDEEQKKKRAATGPVLAKTTGRVTVILPKEQ